MPKNPTPIPFPERVEPQGVIDARAAIGAYLQAAGYFLDDILCAYATSLYEAAKAKYEDAQAEAAPLAAERQCRGGDPGGVDRCMPFARGTPRLATAGRNLELARMLLQALGCPHPEVT